MRKENGRMSCLSGSLTRIGGELTGELLRLGNGLSGSLTRKGERLTGYISIVCTSNRSAYLTVQPDVVWLTPDMISGEFDIFSNVKWSINIPEIEEPESMVLESLSNDTLLANDTLLRNADVTAISVLDNGTLVYNNYYFTNY